MEDLWARQEEFNVQHIDPLTASRSEVISFVKEMVLGIHSECNEILTALGEWKPHRPQQVPVKEVGILEECVDVFKYLMNILIVNGYGPKPFIDEFHRKSKVVEDRFRWENALLKMAFSEKVAAIDLDGVLAQYPESWLDFLQNHGYPHLTMENAKGWHMFPSIPRDKYYYLKHKFRDLGFESLTPKPFDDAAEFTKCLKDMGYDIVVLSSRPYKEYKRIQTDTSIWLDTADITVDAFVWDSKKRDRIVSQFPKLSFFVEDSRSTANEIGLLGIQVFLRDRPYNHGPLSPNVVRVESLLDILPQLEEGKQE